MESRSEEYRTKDAGWALSRPEDRRGRCMQDPRTMDRSEKRVRRSESQAHGAY